MVVPDGWEGPLGAAERMGCGEGCTARTMSRESCGLPTIANAQGVLKCLLVQGDTDQSSFRVYFLLELSL